MMDARTFEDALQQCLEGTADAATQKAVIEAARERSEFQAALLDEAAFDALLRARGFDRKTFASNVMDSITRRSGAETFTRDVAGKIRRQRKTSRVLRWTVPLAVAASLLLAFGIGLWRTAGPTAAVIATVATFEGEPKAFVERQGARLSIKPGDSIRLGDTVKVQGRGRIVLTNEQRGLRMIIGRQGHLSLGQPNRFLLSQGRLEAEIIAPSSVSDAIAILTDTAEAHVVGTRLILIADPTNTRIRIEKGRVLFKAVNSDEAVEVAAGECAMVHRDRESIFKAEHTPGMTVEGRIVFSDNFESDIARWRSALVDEDRNIAPYPDNLPPFASWKQVERDGVTTGCMEINGASEQPEGQPSMLPRDLELPDQGFSVELDIFYHGPSVSYSSLAYYFDRQSVLYDMPEKGLLFTRMMNEKRWGRKRMLYWPVSDPNALYTHANDFFLDTTLLHRHVFAQRFTPLPALKCRRGRVLIANITVRELLTFE